MTRRAPVLAAALALATLVAFAAVISDAKDLITPGPPLRYQRPTSPLLIVLPSGDLIAMGGDLRYGHYAEAERLPANGRRWRSAGTAPTKGSALLADAALLRDGRVLVIDLQGGSSLYDPARNRWRVGPPVGAVRGKAALAALPDGTALASGGCCAEKSSDALSAAEI